MISLCICNAIAFVFDLKNGHTIHSNIYKYKYANTKFQSNNFVYATRLPYKRSCEHYLYIHLGLIILLYNLSGV